MGLHKQQLIFKCGKQPKKANIITLLFILSINERGRVIETAALNDVLDVFYLDLCFSMFKEINSQLRLQLNSVYCCLLTFVSFKLIIFPS